jgi:hypothetical protein
MYNVTSKDARGLYSGDYLVHNINPLRSHFGCSLQL